MASSVLSTLPKQALSLAIAAIVSQSAFAEKALDDVVVTAGESSADTVIELETLEKMQATDLEDIFKQTPEVNVGGGFSTAQKIYVRGIEDTNLNVTVDGATQAGYIFHHQGRVAIEPELLKQVEVHAGAGLATDGPGALGGAIRFITKDPEELLNDGEDFSGAAKVGYFSNTDGLKLNATLAGRASDNLSAMVSLTRQDSENIEDGNGNEQDNTASEIDSGLVKVVGKIDADQIVRLSYDLRNDDGTRNVRPHFGAFEWNPENKQESHRETTNVQYNLNPDNDAVNLQANVYYTRAFITQNPDDGRKDGAGVKSYGLDLRNTQQLGKQQLTYGLDYRQDTGYYINPETPVDDEVLDVYSLYLQDRVALADDLTLDAGIRYDNYDLDEDNGQNHSSDGVSPNLGLTYQLTQELTVRGGYASALRGVVVKEAYLLGYAEYDSEVKEQKADNLELGIDYAQHGFSAGATAYQSKIKDALGRNGRVISNVGDIKTKGFTLYAAQRWDATDLSVSYNYNRPELDGEPLDDGNLSLGTSTGDTLVASLSHVLPQYNLELGWSTEVVQRLTELPDDRQPKAGYNVHDVYAYWTPKGNDDLSLTLTVKNLFDRGYLSHGSYGVDTDDDVTVIGLNEPGRDIRLTLAAKF